jgi:hypothetical protein
MNWIKRAIRRWLNNDGSEMDKPVVISSALQETDDRFNVTFALVPAENGMIVKQSYYRPVSGPGPDWHHKMYIVKENETLPEVLTRLAVAHMLERK